MPYADPVSCLGLIVSGDLGGLTIYTDRWGRKIAFAKSPPQKPATALQRMHRDRFRAAQQQYMALSPQVKADWENLVRRTCLCMTGQNLYIHLATKSAPRDLATLINQSGIYVDPPTYL